MRSTSYRLIRMAIEMAGKVGAFFCRGFNRTAAIGAHERQLFDKLLWGLVTSTIFVRC